MENMYWMQAQFQWNLMLDISPNEMKIFPDTCYKTSSSASNLIYLCEKVQ